MADYRYTLFVSDTHGYMRELFQVLAQIGVTDLQGRWLAGDQVRLIHLGDVVDRGPDSVKMWMWLHNLRQQLGADQVVQKFGNHCMQYLAGYIFGIEHDIEKELVDSGLMHEQVRNGDLKIAYAITDHEGEEWLCVHGGLHPSWEETANMSAYEAADYLNSLLPEVVFEQKPHRIILGSDYTRGGPDPLSGVVWCDVVDNLGPNADRIKIKQIVGHRPQEQGINLRCDGKVFAVNVPYGDAQVLVLDHENGFAPSPRLQIGTMTFPEGCIRALDITPTLSNDLPDNLIPDNSSDAQLLLD